MIHRNAEATIFWQTNECRCSWEERLAKHITRGSSPNLFIIKSGCRAEFLIWRSTHFYNSRTQPVFQLFFSSFNFSVPRYKETGVFFMNNSSALYSWPVSAGMLNNSLDATRCWPFDNVAHLNSDIQKDEVPGGYQRDTLATTHSPRDRPVALDHERIFEHIWFQLEIYRENFKLYIKMLSYKLTLCTNYRRAIKISNLFE